MKIPPGARLALVTALLSTATAAARADYSFNFNNGTDAGLTHYDPLAPFGSGATYTFSDGGYRLTSNPSASPDSLGPARVGSFQASQSFGDFRMSVDVVNWNPQFNQAIGLAARLGNIGLGTSDGYFLHYNSTSNGSPGDLFLERIDGEQSAASFSDAALTTPLTPSGGFRLVFTGIGSTLTGRIFALSDLNTALASVTLVDSTYKSGLTGVLATGLLGGPNVGVDATFDNLQASAVPEPAGVAMLATGLAGALGYGWRRRTR